MYFAVREHVAPTHAVVWGPYSFLLFSSKYKEKVTRIARIPMYLATLFLYHTMSRAEDKSLNWEPKTLKSVD